MIKLEMQNFDMVVFFRSKIREFQGVCVLEYVFIIYGGVVNDVVKFGDIFKFLGEDVYYCFYLWFCECYDCLLFYNVEDVEFYMLIMIGNVFLFLIMMVKFIFMVIFLWSYFGILFYGNINFLYKGNKLKD